MAAWYRTGTIGISGKTVTGEGTNWTDNKMGIGAGQALLVPADGDVKIYEIARVDSATQLTLVADAGSLAAGSEYAIMSFYTDSRPDFARRLSAQLGYYQSLADDLQIIMTGTGSVTVTAPDGREVTISSFKKLTDDMAYYQSQMDDWQEIMTGTGEVTITAPDGREVTISSLKKLTDDMAGKAGLVDGAVPVDQGGTGAKTAADARKNLGLGDAATGYLADSGWLKIPLLDRKSVIIQWGMCSVTAPLSSSSGVKAYDGKTTFNYPIAFPNAALMVNATPMDSAETLVETATVYTPENSVATLRLGGVSLKTDPANSADFMAFVVAIGY